MVYFELATIGSDFNLPRIDIKFTKLPSHSILCSSFSPKFHKMDSFWLIFLHFYTAIFTEV